MGDLKTNLRRFRTKGKLTREQLAVKAGLSYSYIVGLEIGRRDNPSLEILEKLANALSVSIDELAGRKITRG